MVATPDDRDLSNKEKEHTHTYSTEKQKRRSDKKVNKESHRFYTAMLWCNGRKT